MEIASVVELKQPLMNYSQLDLTCIYKTDDEFYFHADTIWILFTCVLCESKESSKSIKKNKQAVIWVTVLENIGYSLIVIHKSISIETGRISESITMWWRLFLLWL